MLLKTYLRKHGIRQQDFAADLTHELAMRSPRVNERPITQGAISKMVHGMYRPRLRIRAAIWAVTHGRVGERDWPLDVRFQLQRRARGSKSGA